MIVHPKDNVISKNFCKTINVQGTFSTKMDDGATCFTDIVWVESVSSKTR